jgi:hypothetical protein
MLVSFPNNDQIDFVEWYVIYLFSFIYNILFRWCSEKYDGIRACWHPSKKTIYLYSFLYFYFVFVVHCSSNLDIN